MNYERREGISRGDAEKMGNELPSPFIIHHSSFIIHNFPSATIP